MQDLMRSTCLPNYRFDKKSVTLNDLERRNGPYFSLFYRIWLWPLPAKGMCSASSDVFRFWDISGNISETVPSIDTVAIEDS